MVALSDLMQRTSSIGGCEISWGILSANVMYTVSVGQLALAQVVFNLPFEYGYLVGNIYVG